MRSAAGLTALVAVSAVLRTRALDGALWIDEALSRGIASHDVTQIPGLLRLDGSPPLYYVLLHGWMDVVGDSEAALRALSLVFALATIPAAYWAATAVAGRRCGWIAAVVAAFNPFLTIYAQEARMYTLVALLSVVLTGALVRGFVDGERRFQLAFGIVLALLLYTHTWAVFVGVGSAAALAVLALRDRAVLRPAAVALGLVAASYLPWLPTLLDQARHTGAPWSDTPSVVALVGALPHALGRGAGVAVVAAVAAIALAVRPPRGRVARVALGVAVLAVATLLVAWTWSQVSPVWANRYLAVVIGPGIVLAALGLQRAGRLGVATAGALAVLWLTFDAPAAKSNAKALGARLGEPVALVISTQPEQVPLLDYYLPGEPRFGTPFGPVADPRVVDWRDATERLRVARPEPTIAAAVRALAPGSRLVLVEPIADGPGWDGPWQRLVLARGGDVRAYLAGSALLRRRRELSPPGAPTSQTNVRATVFERV